jgi:hypothetical protein
MRVLNNLKNVAIANPVEYPGHKQRLVAWSNSLSVNKKL